MFFETIGLAFCSCVLLAVEAYAALVALVNYRAMFAGQRLWNRLRWLALAAAPIVALTGIVVAWIALFSGNSGGAAVAMLTAGLWTIIAGALFLLGTGRPQVYTWTSRTYAASPDIIVLPALPPEDEEPRNSL